MNVVLNNWCHVRGPSPKSRKFRYLIMAYRMPSSSRLSYNVRLISKWPWICLITQEMRWPFFTLKAFVLIKACTIVMPWVVICQSLWLSKKLKRTQIEEHQMKRLPFICHVCAREPMHKALLIGGNGGMGAWSTRCSKQEDRSHYAGPKLLGRIPFVGISILPFQHLM